VGAERPGRPVLEVRRLGRTRYEDAHALQEELLRQRIAGETGDLLLLTEHEPVITLGRKSSREDVAGVTLAVVEVERGGEATWHGPGQLVAYPIVALEGERRDLHRYLRDLEEVVIRVLAEFDVRGERRAGLTGVWIGDRKVASIGVAVRRWVAWHGLALNVHTDPAAFEGFRPCGLAGDVMTRLVDHADLPSGLFLIEVLVIKHFCEVLGFDLPPPPPPPPARFPELPILPG
jgi:lipoyl(octanoyl) transferase